jgi:hypothetical protein
MAANKNIRINGVIRNILSELNELQLECRDFSDDVANAYAAGYRRGYEEAMKASSMGDAG